MDPKEFKFLEQKLLENPDDKEVLAAAHVSGLTDPEGYAILLGTVASKSTNAKTASRYCVEAARAWFSAGDDGERALALLERAVTLDPVANRPARLLSKLYRNSNDIVRLASMLERRGRALVRKAATNPALVARTLPVLFELAWVCGPSGLDEPARALSTYREILALDSASIEAIRGAQEILVAEDEYAEVVALCDKELALVRDPEETVAACLRKAKAHIQLGQHDEAIVSLRRARRSDPDDYTVVADLANYLLRLVQAGTGVSPHDRREAAQLFLQLAEVHQDDDALTHALCALDAEPANDEAMALATELATELGMEDEVAARWPAYLAAAPDGRHADALRFALSQRLERDGDIDLAIATLAQARPDTSPRSGIRMEEICLRTGRIEELLAWKDGFLNTLPPPERLQVELGIARLLSDFGRQSDAAARYIGVLRKRPAEPEALEFVGRYLRATGEFAQLRELLLAAANDDSRRSSEHTAGWLWEAARIAEGPLGDVDGAIRILTTIIDTCGDDSAARAALRRVLTTARRWDELVGVLEQDADRATAAGEMVSVLLQLARIHELERGDLLAAASTYGRAAQLVPDDMSHLMAACGLLERANHRDEAIGLATDVLERLQAPERRCDVLHRLGQLHERAGSLGPAGDAFAAEARITGRRDGWQDAERCYVAANRCEQAAEALQEERKLASEGEIPKMLVREASHWATGGNMVAAIGCLQKAVALPYQDGEAAEVLVDLYHRAHRYGELVELLSTRASAAASADERVQLLKRAASIRVNALNDPQGACDILVKTLQDGERADVLRALADLEERCGMPQQAAAHLQRLVAITQSQSERFALAIRQAQLLASDANDPTAAIERYEALLEDGVPNAVEILDELTRLEEGRDNPKAAARALQRRIELTEEGDDRLALLRRLADLCFGSAGDPDLGVSALERIVASSPDDHEAKARLSGAYESAGRWVELNSLLEAMESKTEAPNERGLVVIRRAKILQQRIGDTSQALQILRDAIENEQCTSCRDLFVEIADHAGHPEEVAAALFRWHAGESPSPRRTKALLDSLSRFIGAEKARDAAAIVARLSDETTPTSVPVWTEPLSESGTIDNAAVVAVLREARELVETTAGKRFVLRALNTKLDASPPHAQLLSTVLEELVVLDPQDRALRLRLADAYEVEKRWPEAAATLRQWIAEAPENCEREEVVIRLARILLERLDDVEGSLDILAENGEKGSTRCREEYVRIGDEQGRRTQVADAIRSWYESEPESEVREHALQGAIERYQSAGALREAVNMVHLVARSPGFRERVAALEAEVANAGELDVLERLHEAAIQGMEGVALARERVRQAELSVSMGGSPLQAMARAERGLLGISLEEAAPLLDRLAALVPSKAEIVGLYERQVARAHTPEQRRLTLARAARVAALHAEGGRCRRLFVLAIASAQDMHDIDDLERTAREVDATLGGNEVRGLFAEALVLGGVRGASDGKYRSNLFRRAALIAYRDLDETDKAVEWFGEALFARVDGALEATLLELREEVRDLRQATIRLDRVVRSLDGHGQPLSAPRGSADADLGSANEREARRDQAETSVPSIDTSFVAAEEGEADEGEADEGRTSDDGAEEEATITLTGPNGPRPSVPYPTEVGDEVRREERMTLDRKRTTSRDRRHAETLRGWPTDSGPVRGDELTRVFDPSMSDRKYSPLRSLRGPQDRRHPFVPPGVRQPVASMLQNELSAPLNHLTGTRTKTGLVRPSSEDLIIEVFEAAFELRMQPTLETGAEFILSLCLEKLLGIVAVLHRLDEKEGDFVIVNALGDRADRLVGKRTERYDPVAAETVRRGWALLSPGAGDGHLFQGKRWRSVRFALSSVVTAVIPGPTEIYGFIELVNPKAMPAFREAEAHALTYLAERFAEFVSEVSQPADLPQR